MGGWHVYIKGLVAATEICRERLYLFLLLGVELPFPTPRASDVWLLKFINSAWPIWRTFGTALYTMRKDTKILSKECTTEKICT